MQLRPKASLSVNEECSGFRFKLEVFNYSNTQCSSIVIVVTVCKQYYCLKHLGSVVVAVMLIVINKLFVKIKIIRNFLPRHLHHWIYLKFLINNIVSTIKLNQERLKHYYSTTIRQGDIKHTFTQ